MPQRKGSGKKNAQAKANRQAVKAKGQKATIANFIFSHARILEVSAGILAAISGYIASGMSNTNMSVTVWTTWLAVCLASLAGAIGWQKYLWDRNLPHATAIQTTSTPSTLQMNNEQPNISSSNQGSNNFTGINQGTVNFGSANTDKKLDEILAKMETYQKSHAPDLSKEFPLGYSLFTMKGRNEIIPLQAPSWGETQFDWGKASIQIIE